MVNAFYVTNNACNVTNNDACNVTNNACNDTNNDDLSNVTTTYTT